MLFCFENNFSANEILMANLVSTKQNECKCICRINIINFQKTAGSN